MTSIQPDPVMAQSPHRPQWIELFEIREMWASLAISTAWLAVMIDALFGPDFVGNDGTTIPSAIFVGFFAWLASVSIARYGFGGSRKKR